MPRRTTAILLVVLLRLAIAPPATAASQDSAPGVRFTSELATNYLLHLFAVADIGFTCDHALRHRHLLPPDDLALLQRHRDLLAFGNGRSGPLTFTFFFLPAWLDLPDTSAIAAYFSLLAEGLATNDYAPLFTRFPVDWQDPFLAQNRGLFLLDAAQWQAVVQPQLDLVEALARVFGRNAASYAETVWPTVDRELQARARHLGDLFADSDIIQRWEQFTELRFGGDYTIVLCHANGRGPDANTLSFDRNVFYYGSDDRHLVEFVSHEVGTHLLHGPLIAAADLADATEAEFLRRYAAFEVLAMFYNRLILGRDELVYDLPQFDADRLLAIYAEHHAPGVSPATLLGHALDGAP
jgi:hypothetical protein